MRRWTWLWLMVVAGGLWVGCVHAAWSMSMTNVLYFRLNNGLVATLIPSQTAGEEILTMPSDIDKERQPVFMRPVGSADEIPFLSDTDGKIWLHDNQNKLVWRDGDDTVRAGERYARRIFFTTSHSVRLPDGRYASFYENCSYAVCFAYLVIDDGLELYLGGFDIPETDRIGFGTPDGFSIRREASGFPSLWRGADYLGTLDPGVPPYAIIPHSAPCPPHAIEPLFNGETKLTGAGFYTMSRNLYFRHLLDEGYLRDGHRSAAWDDDVIRLIGGFVTNFFHSPKGLNEEKRYKLAEKIKARGCTDPYVLFIQAMSCKSSKEAAPILREILPFFSNPERPQAFMQFLVEYALGTKGEYKYFMIAAHTMLERAAVDGSFRPEELRRLIFHFNEHSSAYSYYNYSSDYGTLAAMARSNEQLDPWFRNVFAASQSLRDCLQRMERAQRNKFEPEHFGHWKQYVDELALIRQELLEAIEINPDYPEPFRFLIMLQQVSADCPQLEARHWLDEGIKRQFDFMPLYQEIMEIYSGKFGGNTTNLFQLGMEFARTERYDTQVPDYIYRTLETIREDTGNLGDVLHLSGAKELLLKTAEKYVERNTWRTRNLTRAAVVAHFYGDYQRAAAYLRQIPKNTRLNRRIMETFDTSERKILADINTHAGETVGREHESTMVIESGRQEQLVALVEQQLATGEWTPLMFPGTLDAWQMRYGELAVQSDGSGEAKSAPRGFQIRGGMALGDIYEYAVDFEIVIPEERQQVTWSGGIGTYNSPPPFGGAGICNAEVFGTYYTNNAADFRHVRIPTDAFNHQYHRPHTHQIKLGRNTLLLRANGSYAKVYLNGELIESFNYKTLPGQKVFPYMYRPQIAMSHNETNLRYGNVRARRLAPGTDLDALPPPENIPNPVWVAEVMSRVDAINRMAKRGMVAAVKLNEETQESTILSVQNLPENQEPMWIFLIQPEGTNTAWQIAWDDSTPTPMSAVESTYTIMFTTNLLEGFTPLQTGVTGHTATIPIDAPTGFFHIEKEN